LKVPVVYDPANKITKAGIRKINSEEKSTCLLVIFTFGDKMFIISPAILKLLST
jgi:hypothetical protein